MNAPFAGRVSLGIRETCPTVVLRPKRSSSPSSATRALYN